MVWKFYGNIQFPEFRVSHQKLCGNCVFHFHTRNIDKNRVFCAGMKIWNWGSAWVEKTGLQVSYFSFTAEFKNEVFHFMRTTSSKNKKLRSQMAFLLTNLPSSLGNKLCGNDELLLFLLPTKTWWNSKTFFLSKSFQLNVETNYC